MLLTAITHRSLAGHARSRSAVTTALQIQRTGGDYHVAGILTSPGFFDVSRTASSRSHCWQRLLTSIERETRIQLNRMLGKAGFDSRRDILGLT